MAARNTLTSAVEDVESPPIPLSGRKKILVVSDSLGRPVHRRGIFYYTSNLVRAASYMRPRRLPDGGAHRDAHQIRPASRCCLFCCSAKGAPSGHLQLSLGGQPHLGFSSIQGKEPPAKIRRERPPQTARKGPLNLDRGIAAELGPAGPANDGDCVQRRLSDRFCSGRARSSPLHIGVRFMPFGVLPLGSLCGGWIAGANCRCDGIRYDTRRYTDQFTFQNFEQRANFVGDPRSSSAVRSNH